MSDIQLFDTRKEAEKEIATMRGWTARAKQIEANTGQDIEVKWCIQCTADGKTVKFLREDGYVR